LINIFEVPKI